jgi:hypothetical protein
MEGVRSILASTAAFGQGLTVIGKLLGHTQFQSAARYAHPAANSVQLVADAMAQTRG